MKKIILTLFVLMIMFVMAQEVDTTEVDSGIYYEAPIAFTTVPTIGKPVQCTGLLTSSINKILKLPKNIILNKIGKARIFAPDGSFVDINFKNYGYFNN